MHRKSNDLILEHENLPPFEEQVRNIHKVAFTSGLKYLENNRKTIDDLEKEPVLYKPFIKYCHKGYDKAQKEIAHEIKLLFKLKERRIRSLSGMRSNRMLYEKEKLLIYIIENRIIVLRRLIDSIAYTLFQGKPWIARRFVLDGIKIRDINTDAMQLSLNRATVFNNRDKQTFSLVTDLSTFIDVGDLIQINYRDRPPSWKIIELKEGKVNALLHDILREEGEDLSERKIKEIEKEISSSAGRQIKRMVKQRKRMSNIEEIIRNDVGKDISLDREITVSHDEIYTEGYGEVLMRAVDGAKEKKVAAHIIDNCLYVLAVKDSKRKSMHLLYHLLKNNSECALEKGSVEAIKEFEAINDLSKSHFTFDFVNSNFYAKSSPPFFLYGFDYDSMFDLLYDRTRMLLHLDVDGFAELCESKGIKLQACSKKETERIKQELSRKIAPLYKGRFLKAVMPNSVEHTLLGGTFHKIFVDVMKPSELIDVWLAQSDEMEERMRTQGKQ